MMARTSELLDHFDIWRTDPKTAFESFLASPEYRTTASRKATSDARLRPLSVDVYRAMFGNFCEWISSKQINFLDVTSDDILAFLDGTQSSGRAKVSKIRLRYLRMFERIYGHLNVRPNPAQQIAYAIEKSGDYSQLGRNESTAFLTEEQQEDFMRSLPESPPPTSRHDPITYGWKRRRDRAIQAMILGAGLRVMEVAALCVDNIGEVDGTGSMPIEITARSTNGLIETHITLLRPFAVLEVMKWVEERMTLNIPGTRLLFPAKLSGGAGDQLDHATIYRQIKETYKRAGIEARRRGGRTLRNSFAVRELAAGVKVEEVKEFMGHREKRSTEYYAEIAGVKPVDGNPHGEQLDLI